MTSIPRVVEAGRKAYGRKRNEAAVELFFDLSERIPKSVATKDYKAVIQYCIGTLPLLEQRVVYEREMAKQYGNPRGEEELSVAVRAISFACRLLPIVGARGQIENLKEAVDYFSELGMYSESVQLALESIDTVQSIRIHLRTNPGTKQNQLKKAIDHDDGRHLSQLVKDMENLGQLERRKVGNTYELRLIDEDAASASNSSASSPPQPPIEGALNQTKPKRSRWWKRG